MSVSLDSSSVTVNDPNTYKLVLPGDKLDLNPEVPITLGPGVYCDPKTQDIIPVNAGLENVQLNSRGNNQLVYIDYDSRRYICAVGDFVIGTIVSAFSDSYKVALSNFSQTVSLSYMSFPNATKKNRPTLKIGDLVYARVLTAAKELEAEIECMDSSTGQDSGFGLLEDGVCVDVPLSFCRKLLFDDQFPLLRMLSKFCKFEVAVGVNGKVWVKCDDIKNTLACYRSILQCSKSSINQYSQIIKNQFKILSNTVDE
ncbi:exosome non-catalytic core subunit RRP40 PWA37_002972 [Arxiozyma heterogenica]|uniref:Ribosomal RNA-processing protein 40 n=1 Tax=Arxiozyma heterogenica TaxID=278026 RepID=A0AAN7VZI8_9SACH|nr:hypothetical protein RI543_004548 [Kazachstania heterogenica]